MKEKICKNCGKIFIPSSSRQLYCGEERVWICEYCGNEFKAKCSSYVPRTCSTACQSALIKESRRKSISEETRICKWCGKEFHPIEFRDAYCSGPHYKKCRICGKDFEIDVRRHSDTETCSKECMKKLMSINHDFEKGYETQKQTLRERYGEGVTNPMQIPGVIDKIKKTNVEKYGTEWYTQTQEYRDSVKKSDREKYGVDHHLQSKEVINKRIETNKVRYGVENVFQSEDIKSAIKKVNLERYGVENVGSSPEFIMKVKQNNLKRYGVTHPMMLPEFKEKALRTNIERYGRHAVTQCHIENIQNWYSFINDPRSYIETNYSSKVRTAELAEDLGVDQNTVGIYLKKNSAFDCIRNAKSLMEENLTDFITTLVPDISLINNTKSIIKPYELDIYLPDYNFAIECNPTCTHNSSVADPWGGSPKDRNYHKLKTDMCEKEGIFLLHVFGYEWSNNRDVIESMIENVLKQNQTKIYARKCKVKDISWADSKSFLDSNHRQGSANSPIRLGLFYNDELVSVMTFGKMRGSIGTGSEDLSDCYELVRFCNKKNTSVVGGASKLFKHFQKEYRPVRVRSFSDRAHTRGTLYPTLGFKEVVRSDPGYVWVNVIDDRAYNRVNAQKQNIKKFLKDDDIDLSRTEKEIMIEHGFVQVFDSGTITWEWQSY